MKWDDDRSLVHYIKPKQSLVVVEQLHPVNKTMVELLYGSGNYAQLAWQEICEGRPVTVRVAGWRKGFIHRTLFLYAEYDRVYQAGAVARRLPFGLAWRIMLAPALLGLCEHARQSGMELVVRDKGSTLEVRFQKPHVAASTTDPQPV